MSVEIVPAGAADVSKFARGQLRPTMRAWVGKEADEPIALFGFARGPDARWYAFFDITDKARPHKKLIVRTAKTMMDDARRMGLRYVYAQIDENETLARRWMRSLGFADDPRSGGQLMRWVNGEVE